MLNHHLNLDDFPDSPYAHELRVGLQRLGFEEALEREYTLAHLERVRLRVRIWFSVAAAVSVLFTLGQLSRAGVSDPFSLLYLVGLLPCVAVLALLVWSPLYTRYYLLASRVLVTVFSSLTGVLIANALFQGQEEQLAALTVDMMAVFFFAGLKFRDAFAIGAATVMAFIIIGLLIGLERALFIKSLFALGVTAITSAIVYWDVEQAYRRSFLEGALINELVARDGLTSLMNRRSFDLHLDKVWQQALRNSHTIAILMIDIDYFKRYNDEYGHQVGDLALKSVAQVIQGFARRPLDLAARYGGEEFVLILYEMTLQHLQEVTEQLRSAVEEMHAVKPEMPSGITISIGVGMATPLPGRSSKGAVQLADEALYEAKLKGRNRTVIKGIEDYLQLVTGAYRTGLRRG